MAVTFDVHPSSVLAPDHAPPLVYPLGKRLQVLGDCGMRAALLLHFDAAFSRVERAGFCPTGLAEGALAVWPPFRWGPTLASATGGRAIRA